MNRRIAFKRIPLSLLIYCMMGINRLLILMVPFKKLAPRIGSQISEEVSISWNKKERGRAYVIRNIVDGLSGFTPWESKCFVQALTAAQVMKIFRIDGVMHFGVRKDSDGLKAHAWIIGDNMVVTGESGMEGFASVAMFLVKK